MSYIVVDTEVGGGFPIHTHTTPIKTLKEALDHRTSSVQAYAKDGKMSLEKADWVLEGTIVFEILPPGSTVVPLPILVHPEYEPMYAVIKDGEITQVADCMDQLQYMWPEKIGRVHPIQEVANRIDGSFQWSYDTPEPA